MAVIVARAGATTSADVTALGLPTIFFPRPYVTAHLQASNGRAVAQL
ncbi:glycosyltransferase, partial [Bacillus altitudinis]